MADGSGAAGGRLHLLKLCVGTDSIAGLADWQEGAECRRLPHAGRACPVHVTRMWPRREAELLAGGSLYWVIRGAVAVRQRILALAEADAGDGLRRCAIVLDPDLVRVEARSCRPFQGWRYLTAAEAPRDLAGVADTADALPPALRAALGEIGLRER